jgi:hypothetical protein
VVLDPVLFEDPSPLPPVLLVVLLLLELPPPFPESGMLSGQKPLDVYRGESESQQPTQSCLEGPPIELGELMHKQLE